MYLDLLPVWYIGYFWHLQAHCIKTIEHYFTKFGAKYQHSINTSWFADFHQSYVPLNITLGEMLIPFDFQMITWNINQIWKLGPCVYRLKSPAKFVLKSPHNEHTAFWFVDCFGSTTFVILVGFWKKKLGLYSLTWNYIDKI